MKGALLLPLFCLVAAGCTGPGLATASAWEHEGEMARYSAAIGSGASMNSDPVVTGVGARAVVSPLPIATCLITSRTEVACVWSTALSVTISSGRFDWSARITARHDEQTERQLQGPAGSGRTILYQHDGQARLTAADNETSDHGSVQAVVWSPQLEALDRQATAAADWNLKIWVLFDEQGRPVPA